MIYNYNGKWFKGGSELIALAESERNAQRRELFKRGLFKVEKQNTVFIFKINNRAIRAWYPNDKQNARDSIDIAFDSYIGLKYYFMDLIVKGGMYA